MEAVASDPDGTISKVEFYNGNKKLAEIATAPYSFKWEYVDTGTYSITARAIDNLNAATVSAPVWVEVDAELLSLDDVNSEVFNLYPNPNDGHFSIVLIEPVQNENRTVNIITFDGRTIYKGPLLKEEITKQFELPNIKPGTYILIIAGKNIIATKKFIKT